MPGSHQGGRNPTQLPAPVLPQSQSLSKAKAIKTPIILRICYHLARHLILLSRMCLALSDPRARERPLVISQSLALLAGCSNASLSMACVMRRRFGVIVGLTLPADLAYLRRRRARLVVWTLFHYCEFTLLLYGVCRLMTGMMAETKLIRSVNRTTTVTHPRRCLRSSIRCEMWPSTYVSSRPLT